MSSLKNAYLFVYNITQFAAWLYAMDLIVMGFLKNQTPAETYSQMGSLITIAQNAAILEVLHSIFGVVRSPWFTTALQVASRVLLVNIVAYVPVAQQHWISQWMFAAWALVEIVRYAYYAINIVSSSMPYFLTWIRYSIFLFDYPCGVAGELGTLYISLPYIKAQNEYAYYALIFIMLSYIWGLPTMYSFMLKQRKKYLSPSSSKSTKSKSKSKKTQ